MKNVYLIIDKNMHSYEAVMEAHESFDAAMNSEFWEDHGLTPDENGWTSDYFIHDCLVNVDLRPQTSPVPGEHDFWGPRIRTLGAHIEDEFPGLGYVVLLLPFYRLGNVAYISNARREDIVSMMKDTVRQFEEGLEKPAIGDFVNSDEIAELSIHEDYRCNEAAEAMFRACKQLFPSLKMEAEIDDDSGICKYKISN